MPLHPGGIERHQRALARKRLGLLVPAKAEPNGLLHGEFDRLAGQGDGDRDFLVRVILRERERKRLRLIPVRRPAFKTMFPFHPLLLSPRRVRIHGDEEPDIAQGGGMLMPHVDFQAG
jgi:hypothetical protein